MTKRHGMKKKGRFKQHFKRHWKKYALAGAGLAGGGAALTSQRALRGIFNLAGKAKGKGWGKTESALRNTGFGLAALRHPVKAFKNFRYKRSLKKTG